MLIISNKKESTQYKVGVYIGLFGSCLPIYHYFEGKISAYDSVMVFSLIFGITTFSYVCYRYSAREIKLTNDTIEILNPVTGRSYQIYYSEINEVEVSDLTGWVYVKTQKDRFRLGTGIHIDSGEFTVPVPGPAAAGGIGPHLKDEVEARVQRAKEKGAT